MIIKRTLFTSSLRNKTLSISLNSTLLHSSNSYISLLPETPIFLNLGLVIQLLIYISSDEPPMKNECLSFDINGIIVNAFHCNTHFSLNNYVWNSSILIPAAIVCSFSLLYSSPIEFKYDNLLINFSTRVHLDCYQCLACTNKFAKNILGHNP